MATTTTATTTTTTSLARSAPHTRTVQGKSSSRRLQRIRRPNANKFKNSSAAAAANANINAKQQQQQQQQQQPRRGSANSHLFHAPLLQEGDDDNDDMSQFQFSIDPSQYQQQCVSSNELTVDDESLYYDLNSQRKLLPQPPPTQEERARRMMVAGTDNSIPTLLRLGESKRLTKDDNVSAMTMQVSMEDLMEECHDDLYLDSSLTFHPDEGLPHPKRVGGSQCSLPNGTAKAISNLSSSMDDTSATEEDDSLQENRRFRWSAPATIPEDSILSHTANDVPKKQAQQKKAVLGRLWKTLFVSSSKQTNSNVLRRSTPTPKATTGTTKTGRFWGFQDEAAATVQQCRQRQRQRAQSVPASGCQPPQQVVVLRVPKSEVPSPGATLHLSQTGVPVWHNESGRVLPFTSSEC